MRSVGATLSAACALLLLAAPSARAEDGYELWLRYRPLAPSYATKVAAIAPALVVDAPPSPTVDAATAELGRAFGVWAGHPLAVASEDDATLLLCRLDQPCAAALPQRSVTILPGAYRIDRLARGRIVISADDDIGLLYGSFALLRHIPQQGT